MHVSYILKNVPRNDIPFAAGAEQDVNLVNIPPLGLSKVTSCHVLASGFVFCYFFSLVRRIVMLMKN